VLKENSRLGLSAEAVGDVLVVQRSSDAGKRVLVVNFGADRSRIADLAPAHGQRRVLLASDGATGDRDHLPKSTAVIFASAR
jgi:hypothetical protein